MLVLTGVLILGIKLSLRVNMVHRRDQDRHRPASSSWPASSSSRPPTRPVHPAGEAERRSGGGLSPPLLQCFSGFTPSTFGVGGIFAGAALVFFAFIGFDIVATTAEETKNPQRDMPRGIIGSLVICTLLYFAVSLVVTGMVKYDQSCRVERAAGRRVPVASAPTGSRR